METIKTTTQMVPLFNAGLYHGPLNPERMYPVNVDDLDTGLWCDPGSFNVGRYQEDIAMIATTVIEEKMAELFRPCGIKKCEVVGYQSPKYYNFEDDVALLDFEVNSDFWDRARKEIAAPENRAHVEKWICEWRSRDGFISYMPQTREEFLAELGAAGTPSPEDELIRGGTVTLLLMIRACGEWEARISERNQAEIQETLWQTRYDTDYYDLFIPEERAKERGLPFVDMQREEDELRDTAYEYCETMKGNPTAQKKCLEWQKKVHETCAAYWERQVYALANQNTDADDMAELHEQYRDALAALAW